MIENEVNHDDEDERKFSFQNHKKCNDLKIIPLFVTLLPTVQSVQYVFQNFGNVSDGGAQWVKWC